MQLQIARDPIEGGRQAAADRLERGDCRNADQGRDEAVFDRGRTAFVIDEVSEDCKHLIILPVGLADILSRRISYLGVNDRREISLGKNFHN